MTLFHKIFTSTVILLLLGSCSVQKSPVTGQKRLYGYTWEQEKQLGQEADSQIIEYYGLLEDAELTAYVTRVGQKVLQESHMRRDGTDAQFRNTEFTFRVLNSPVINAFALPGGFNYVTRGLLTHMTSEAQLAMVLGHEVAHVAARHASQQALQQQAGSLLLVGSAILGEELLGVPAQQVLELGGTAAQLLFLRYSRDAERESDKLGVEYAAMAGYDASQGASFFTTLKRLSDQSGSSIPGFMSSHPDPGEREKDIINRSEGWKSDGYAQNFVGQNELYNAIEGLIIGENPRDGFVENNTFFHPDLAFQFNKPNGYNLINEPSQVIVLPEDQKSVTLFSIEQGSTTEVLNVLANNEQVSVVSREKIQISGLAAEQMNATLVDGENTFGLLVTAIRYQDRTYQFFSYSVQADFDSLSPGFAQIAGSFRTLTDQSKLTIQPARIAIRTINSPTRFSDLLPAQLPYGITPEGMAIMNQVNLTDVIQPGTVVKLIQ
jgi:predicted Zn-dependent protease